MKAFAVLVLLAGSWSPLGAQDHSAHTVGPTPTAVARAYFEAMDQKDLDAAEALFAESSSIFESGGVEGAWEHYRAHHIGAELDAFKTFETTLGEAEEELSADRSMAMVAWPIEYHIVLNDGREIDSKGTVTFILLHQAGGFKIRHMHWSSRPKKKDGA